MAEMQGIDRNEAEWNHNSYSDLSSSDEDLDDLGQGQVSGKIRGAPKRMAEEKLHEKRLKERARRNGMAKSIDQMRLIVPDLMDAKKVYSQAKVVAIALSHIYELQRENGDLRQRLGMKPRDQEPRPIKGKRSSHHHHQQPQQSQQQQPQQDSSAAAVAASTTATASAPSSAPAAASAPQNPAPKREAPAVESADERAKKRRRVDESIAPIAPVVSTPPVSTPSAATIMATSPTAAALLALLPRVIPHTPKTASAAAASSTGAPHIVAPVQMRLSNGSVEEGTLEALVLDHTSTHHHSSSPSSLSSLDEEELHGVSETPLTMSPRHEHDSSTDIFPAAYPYVGSSLWEEHDVEANLRHHSHPDSSLVELMLQSVLNGTN